MSGHLGCKTFIDQVVFVSPKGIMHDALRTLLKSQPNLEIVGSANSEVSAYELLQQKEAQLVVIDNGLPLKEILTLLRLVKVIKPTTRCIVLTVNRRYPIQP